MAYCGLWVLGQNLSMDLMLDEALEGYRPSLPYSEMGQVGGKQGAYSAIRINAGVS